MTQSSTIPTSGQGGEVEQRTQLQRRLGVAPEKADFRPALSSLPFGRALPERTMATYWEKLKDPRWQRKRLEALSHADWVCAACASGQTTLHDHHKRYIRGREPWEYELHELQVLCESCHEEQHAQLVELTEALSRLALDGDGWKLLGYAKGLLVMPGVPEHEMPLSNADEIFGLCDAWGAGPGEIAKTVEECGTLCASFKRILERRKR